jgi:hypothetical protein
MNEQENLCVLCPRRCRAARPRSLKNFTGKVPTPNGMIEVSMDKNSVTVLSEIDGGTLIIGNNKYAIEKNKALTVKF